MTAHVVCCGASIDLLALHQQQAERYPFLLQSIQVPGQARPSTGRYDLLFAFPGEVIQDAPLAYADWAGPVMSASATPQFLAELGERLANSSGPALHAPDTGEILPFAGGWFFYLGYEFAQRIEPRLKLPAISSEWQLPNALAVHCPAAIIVDHLHDRTYCLVQVSDSSATRSGLSAAIQQSRLSVLQADVARCYADDRTAVSDSENALDLPAFELIEEPSERFLSGVERILDYLHAGDCFQANLSRAWDAQFAQAPDPATVYARLRRANPAPFAALMRWGKAAVISSSPERLVALRGTTLETRPIAGTAPRHADAEQDAQQRQALMQSLKDRAEHVMLLDLERNDLGRVCVPGSVRVAELIEVESYALVHHLVSSVCGEMRSGVTAMDVLRALFPGGTITGAPKVRAVEIIAELEAQARGPYTGSLGYCSCDGQMDSNILIRTMTLAGQRLRLRAGAGIVADSQPLAELAETRQKAKGMLRALDPSL